MKTKNTMQSTSLATRAEILTNTKISRKYDTKHLDYRVQALISPALQRGSNLVSLRWPTGEFALSLCKAGTYRPTNQNIVAAYEQCRRIANKSSERKKS